MGNNTNPLQDLQQAAKALREGVATQPQWAVLAGRLQTAKTLAAQGVMPGIHGHLVGAEEALHRIQARASMSNGWQPVALEYHELEAVQTFVDLHAYQVRQLRARGLRQLAVRRRSTRGVAA